MEFESNYPRERALKQSEELRILERAYAFGSLAGLAALFQFLTIGLFIRQSVWLWVVGGIGYVGYLVLAVLTARELRKLDNFRALPVIPIAVGSGLFFCVAPFTTYLVFGIWLSVKVWKMGAKISFRHWSGFDFKGRIKQLEAEGQ